MFNDYRKSVAYNGSAFLMPKTWGKRRQAS